MLEQIINKTKIEIAVFALSLGLYGCSGVGSGKSVAYKHGISQQCYEMLEKKGTGEKECYQSLIVVRF